MSGKNQALAERFHGDIFQNGDLAAADEILSPDFVIHAPGYPPEWTRGPEGAKLLAQAIIAGFPDRKFLTEETLGSGELVMIRWSMTATHEGELFGVPASGRPVSVAGFDLFRIEKGKLVELWQSWDQLGMMQQIGVIPTA